MSLWSTGATASQVSVSVTTNSAGGFSLNYTCPSPSALMYITATGGAVGSGTSNASISLTSALGACGSVPATVVVNEFTSVASAYALNGFSSAAAAPATVKFQGKSPGLDQAFNTLGNLTVTSTGTFDASGPEGNATQVQQILDTLANAMTACDASSTANACAELFTCATPDATYVSSGQSCAISGSPTLATDTLSAAISVIQNAGTAGIGGIFDLGTTNGNAFTPVLAQAPNDMTLPLIFNFSNVGPLAIDAGGHAWVLTPDPAPADPANPTLAVAELDANLNKLSTGPHYFTGGGVGNFHTNTNQQAGMNDVTNLAIDSSGNIWVSGGPNYEKIAELTSTGAGATGAGSMGYSAGVGPDGTAGVTIDSAGNVWAASGSTDSTVFELSSSGVSKSGTYGYTASNCPCEGIAADSTGNIWLLGNGSSSPSQYLAGISATGVQSAPIYPSGYQNNVTLNALAADGSGNLWIADQHNHGVWQFNTSSQAFVPAPTGSTPNNTPYYPNTAALNNTSKPKAIAIDGAGHKWVANSGQASSTSSITELSANGSTNLSPANGFGFGTIGGAYSIAIDGSGNVWVANGGASLVQFIGAAAPTRTPVATAVATGTFIP